MIVNMHGAKTRLSWLIAALETGEKIMIARNNRPVATLKPYSEEKRNPDIYKGRVFMSDDFDDDLPEDILQGFYS